MIDIQRLKWDSSFFDIRIGRIDIETEEDIIPLIEVLHKNSTHFDLLYLFSDIPLSPSQKINLPQLKLVDTKILFKKVLSHSHTTETPCDISIFTESAQNEDLYRLSLLSGSFSRYKTDLRFPSGSFEKLYNTWIEESVNGNIADKVFVHYTKDKIDAMCTLAYKSKEPTIGIIAVDEDAQNIGLGSKLISAAEECVLKDSKYRTLSVATQLQNKAGMKFYKKNGFEIAKVTYVYHYWC